MFYCRENELKKMNKLYDKNTLQCIIIYGRRRVGKTSLINEFCKNKKTIYFSALNATAKENLKALSKSIALCENADTISIPIYQTFDEVFSKITEMAKKEKIVFVIDEYPYLANADKSISSRLQHLLDHAWKETNMYLILCGSSMSFMEYQVLGYESPLYGRRTAQFKITALDYKETSVFNSKLSAEENALIYGITGGVPHYINKLDVKQDVNTALIENLFDRSGYLFEETENLLKQELREPALYNAIITAIADGASRLNEIATKTGLETSICTKYMRVLMDLGILNKETPITEKIRKKSIYQLADNFFRFWYRFVPTNMALISADRIMDAYEIRIKSQFSDYMGLIFKQMCRQYLLKYEKEAPILLCEVGQWWGTDAKTRKQVQIDIVGTSIDGKEYIIGSCKYKNSPIGVDELELLKQYAEVFGKGETYHFYIFSKGGFTEGLRKEQEQGNVKLVTLQKMYEC